MAKNRMNSIKRNPYMQIARKLCQTYNQRARDIKSIKSDLARLNSEQVPRYVQHISDIRPNTDGMQPLTIDEQREALNQHITALKEWNALIDCALDQAVSNINAADLKHQTRRKLLEAYSDSKQEPFYMLAYPLSKSDFDERSRILLKYIIRSLELMPYKKQISFKSKKS